jgi:urease accessory protein
VTSRLPGAPPGSASELLPDLLPFLASLQLSDSAFPSGLYTLSHGLEAYAQAGLLQGGELQALISDLLLGAVAPADGVALVNAHCAVLTNDPGLAAEADLRLSATKLPRESRVASQRTGRQFLDLAGTLFGHPLLAEHARRVKSGELPGNHAVALGLAKAVLGVSREQALAGELFAFTAGCVSAAIRLSLIDHREAQRLLHELKPVIVRAVTENAGRSVHEIASSLPLADLLAAHHERAEVRLFIS